jgi:hypothetical protein
MVNGLVDIEIITDPDHLRLAGQTKPFIRLRHVRTTTGMEVSVDLTVNLAHMIGGLAAGVAERFDLP